MPVVVPALRLAILFLNVYDTFKTLKPPSSSRTDGVPSARAIYKRKRDMKGCLSVWIVWCCLATYERMLDGIVRHIVPFHEEVKSFIMFFLLVTRARGSEPIFLHVIRPLIRPHVETLDSILDLAYMFGNVLIFLTSTPFGLVTTWWYRQRQTENIVVGSSTVRSSEAGPTPSTLPQRRPPATGRRARVATDPGLSGRRRGTQLRQVSDGSTGGLNYTHRRTSVEDDSHQGNASRANVSKNEEPGEKGEDASLNARPSSQHQISSATAPPASNYAVWYPPPAAYAEDDRTPAKNAEPVHISPAPEPSTPPSLSQVQHLTVEEWRLYPPFPAAYPPTPLPDKTTLPPESEHASALRFSSIAEGEEGETTPLPPQKHRQGGMGKQINPNSASAGMGGRSQHLSLDADVNDGDREDEEEDEFDLTLRTPPYSSTQWNRMRGKANRASPASSTQSRSTTLTTVVYDSATRSASFSESSDSSSLSDSSFSGGRRVTPSNSIVTDRIAESELPSSSARAKAATWSPATRRAGALAVPAQTWNNTVESSEATDSEGTNNGSAIDLSKEGNTVGASRNAQRGREKPAKTRSRTTPAPAPAPSRTSARLAAARPAREPMSRTSSQDSGTSGNYSRATLPRNARVKK